MIEIKHLKKSFGSHHVLRDVNLKIEDGKITSILGGSGSGKSTLIKCMMRLLDSDGGEILVNGKDITKVTNPFRLAAVRRHFGYLFQEGALFDSMTVGENVAGRSGQTEPFRAFRRHAQTRQPGARVGHQPEMYFV